MSDPAPIESPAGDDDTSVVLAALTRNGAKGLSVTVAVIHRSVQAICPAAGTTGAIALVLGVWAWHRSLPGAAIAVLGGGAALGAAAYVWVRTRALATAVGHPAEALTQAQDLVRRATGSAELHQLATAVRSRKAVKAVTKAGKASKASKASKAVKVTKVAKLGRARRALRTGRLISSVIGLASPDPERHRYLIPLTPERLRALWLAIVVGLWAWLVSAAIAAVALLTLAVQSL